MTQQTFTDIPEIASLPITPYLSDLCVALRGSPSRFLVLTAQTAAGKSTALPVALLRAFSGTILMLEPRRLAAVAIAERVSQLLGESVGKTVGYRLHLESCVSGATRLEVMTEAILTRRLQADPSLDGVSVVVLDEFHERSIHADLALAFLKEVMQLRDDLFVVVMSATIDTRAVAAYLNDAPVFTVSGRQFPVVVEYAANVSPVCAVLRELARKDNSTVSQNLPQATDCGTKDSGELTPIATQKATERGASTARAAVVDSGIGAARTDSILVFLPGIGDIRRTKQELEMALGARLCSANDYTATDGVAVLVLHSSVPLAEQRAVLAPVPADAPRRIILASAIAETSLTVPGVTTVIDSGFARLNRMNVALGMEQLVTERESAFNAEQRAGRAGRLAAGRCVRLWNQLDALLPAAAPEITRTDLVPLVLECAAWGVTAPENIDWLDKPPSAAWNGASQLLVALGCIDDSGKITQNGAAVLKLGLHPRLACTVLAGLKRGRLRQAVQCALRFSSYAQATPRQQRLFCDDLERRARTIGQVTPTEERKSSDAELLLAGFPDRIGRRIDADSDSDGTSGARTTRAAVYQFPSGRQATLATSVQGNAPRYIVAPEVDAGTTTARIYRYEPLETTTALLWLTAHATTHTVTEFADDNARTARLVKTERTAYGALVLKARRLSPSADDFAAAVCTAVARHGIDWLPLNEAGKSLLLRARFFSQHAEQAGAATAEQARSLQEKLDSLAQRTQDWLAPFLSSTRSLSAESVCDALRWWLDGQTVDKHVPVQLTLANGKTRRIVYEDNGNGVHPVLEVIIQQLFGCFDTPRVLGVPVLLKLLSPARRPLQITDDLAGFWSGTWLTICKEMRGRYPKHTWDYRMVQED